MLDTPITIGGRPYRLEVTQPLGAGGGFHILVDSYYQGCIVLNNGDWKVWLNDGSVLGEDAAAWILERLNSLEMSK